MRRVTIIICGFRFSSALQSGDAAGAQLLAIVAGGFLGFLLFNYKPAKIFMGDTGSMFAGFTLSSLAIAAPIQQTRVLFTAVLYPLLTFLYPIFDTVLVSLLRRVAGRAISVGGRDHSSHRLASLGLGEKKVVWLLWILTGIGSAVGLLTYSMPIGVLAIAFLLAVVITIFGIFLASLPGYEMPPASPGRSSRIRRLVPTLRAGTTLVIDTLLAGISLLAAFLLRWEDNFSGTPSVDLLSGLPIAMACQTAACLILRTFNLGWRWLGLPDLLTLGRCVLLSFSASASIFWILRLHGYSRGIVVLYGFLLSSAMTGFRLLLPLLWHTLTPSLGDRRRAAILGANQSAELLIRILERDKELDATPVLILDTDPAINGTQIHGIPVCFAGSNQLKILREASVNLLILSSTDSGLMPEEQEIIETCMNNAIPVQRLEWHLSPRGLLGQDQLEKTSSLFVLPRQSLR